MAAQAQSPVARTTASRSREILTVEQVVEIADLSLAAKHQSAYKIAAFYRVSEKTVRDIWSGRTWKGVTRGRTKAPSEPRISHDQPHGDPGSASHQSEEKCCEDIVRLHFTWASEKCDESGPEESIDDLLYRWDEDNQPMVDNLDIIFRRLGM